MALFCFAAKSVVVLFSGAVQITKPPRVLVFGIFIGSACLYKSFWLYYNPSSVSGHKFWSIADGSGYRLDFVLVPLSIDISFKNTLLNTGLFYADCCLFMGFMYSDSASGTTTFFMSFSLILFWTAVFDLYHQYNYDVLENVGSYNAYLSHANNKFPYKYTIGLFSIDNRDKLLKVIGERKIQELEQMLVKRICEFPYNIIIYRYLAASELIMVFQNEDAKHTMEYAENIRHVIAASDFVFTNGKKLKITISISVSEKTRLDLNATDVTARAHNSLQKAYRFNCNIVTKA